MKIVAVMPVRNEDWILGLSARAVLMWADELCILDHCSTDHSQRIADEIRGEYPGRVTIHRESDPVWEEMRHRQKLLEMARERQATHIAIVDADEVLTGNLLATLGAPGGIGIRGWFATAPQICVLQISWLCLRGSIRCVHTSGPWADGQNVSMGFADSPELHWSSVGRGGYDFHHRHPMGRPCIPYRPIAKRNAGLMHLQFVSDRRLRAKQYAYQLTERLRWPGREPVDVVRQRYSLSVYGANNPPEVKHALAEVPADWWAPYAHLMEHFHPDAEPWQIEQCRSILRANPGIEKGLDDFGLKIS